jgi:TatD DNase family protein
MLIDTHCHANLYLVLEEILKEASNSGVGKIISVSMSFTSLQRNLELLRFDMIYPALGIHPEEVKANPKLQSQMDSVIEMIRENKNKICAIGEIGLDHHFIKEKELYPLQLEIFNQMLSLAQDLKLPVNIHTKGAEKTLFETLPSYNIPNINIHWYSGPEQYLKQGIDRGYYFSITPAISYSTAVKKTATMVGSDHLLLESDGPVEYNGTIGTPAMIKGVLKAISKLRNIPELELENQIMENTKVIFPKIFE